jgi:hypothetical protein
MMNNAEAYGFISAIVVGFAIASPAAFVVGTALLFRIYRRKKLKGIKLLLIAYAPIVITTAGTFIFSGLAQLITSLDKTGSKVVFLGTSTHDLVSATVKASIYCSFLTELLSIVQWIFLAIGVGWFIRYYRQRTCESSD